MHGYIKKSREIGEVKKGGVVLYIPATGGVWYQSKGVWTSAGPPYIYVLTGLLYFLSEPAVESNF